MVVEAISTSSRAVKLTREFVQLRCASTFQDLTKIQTIDLVTFRSSLSTDHRLNLFLMHNVAIDQRV